MRTHIIAADIGGTKTRLVFARLQHDVEILYEARYQSSDFDSLDAMLVYFIAAAGQQSTGIDVLSLALPGAVENDSVRLTNLPWVVSKTELAQCFGTEQVYFMNDFQAAALGVDQVDRDDLVVLNPGMHRKDAIRAVIGAGTGLGLAWLQGAVAHATAWSTEGGHIDFAPVNPQQIELLEFMLQRHAHVSFERLLSGSGLVTLYEFCSRQSTEEVDAARVQAEADAGNPVAREALRLFVQIYGSYTGNIALLFKPEGGIYISGGIAAKIIRWMQSDDFIAAYLAKGRMEALAKKIPVYVVSDDRVGVNGALSHAVQRQQATYS
ncbi:MAG: glucokinase [Gammaproteobacteria bacterium]|nr:glucokinase [Gammaproteobacteria bacterium]